jgi:hypothetical protein
MGLSLHNMRSWASPKSFPLPDRHGLRAKTIEDMVGGLGPEGGIEGTAFALAADGAFYRAGLEHFGGDLS